MNHFDEISNILQGLQLRGAEAYAKFLFDSGDQAGVAEGIPSGEVRFRGFCGEHDAGIFEDFAEYGG